ncbi:hypothetical protein EBZ80_18560 [bacterium]|nr:hypothetical protein [Betaproteobacteria bacterium]NDE16927.1 hypothetical protein [bacterium]
MSGYRDPAQERMENGRSMLDVMRGSKALKGVIVAAATPGGIPINFDPHDRAKIKINVVDPNGSNVGGLTLDNMTAPAVERAMSAARAAIPGNDINAVRERAAMVFEELAKMEKAGVQRVPSTRPRKVVAPPPPAVEEEDAMLADAEALRQELADETQQPMLPPIEKIDRNYSPMAAFGLKKQSTSSTPANVSPAHKSGPPQKLVYFEKEGIGTVPAFFHDVIVSVAQVSPDTIEENGFIVLVYDLRFEQNAARWFPPSNDPYQRPWAVQISDDRRLYLVHTTGFQYVYDNREYCILLVERALRANYDEA